MKILLFSQRLRTAPYGWAAEEKTKNFLSLWVDKRSLTIHFPYGWIEQDEREKEPFPYG